MKGLPKNVVCQVDVNRLSSQVLQKFLNKQQAQTQLGTENVDEM